MHYILGVVLFAVGGWMLWSASQRRRQVIAAGGPVAPPSDPRNIAFLGEVVPPVVIFFLCFIGLKMTLGYFALDLSRFMGLFDLAGFLFLLASYGYWLVTMTKYREPKAVAADGDSRRDERQHGDPGGAAPDAGSGPGVRGLATEVAEPAEGRAGGQQAA